MTGNPDRSASKNPTSAARASFPFLGFAALIAGAIMPVWAILVVISGGLEAAAWVPVVVLFLFPFNLVFIALFIVAVLCGIYAVRRQGTNRLLGWIGLILAGVQLIAGVAFMVWSSTDVLFGG